jgi:DNA repair ATPase RecN
MRISQLFLPLAVALIVTACGNKEPATNAVTQAEAALSGIRDDATKYSPEELKAPEATLAKMKEDLANKDYRAVVENVPPFNAQIKALQESLVTHQTLAAAAQNEWDTLSAEVPKSVEAIQARVDSLSGAKLPKEITEEAFDTAKAELQTMKATWTEATAAAGAGDAQAAAEKGRTVQAKAEELKAQLGMNPSLASATPPPAPAAN